MRGVLLAALITAVWVQPAAAAAAEGPAVGEAAPKFSLQGSDGKTYTLSQFRGKQGVVIAWFPKAFTPG